MNHQQLYQQCHDIVWTYRNRLERAWPTPPVEDALRFAVTEAAEVIDAELRINPTYARNNDKDLDPLDEVADCLMMLITADANNICYPSQLRIAWEGNLDDLIINCGFAMKWCSSKNDSWSAYINIAITICLNMLGEDAPNRLEQRLKRIEAKVTK